MTTEKLNEYSKRPEFQHCNNCKHFVPFYFSLGPDVPAYFKVQKYNAYLSDDTGLCKFSMNDVDSLNRVWRRPLTEFWRVSCDGFVFRLHPSFDVQGDELKWYIDFKNRTQFKKSKRYGNTVNN